MGAFAKWGAIKGAARGAREAIEARQETRAEAAKTAADQAREERLEQIRQKNREALEKVRGEQERKTVETREAGERETQEYLETGKMERLETEEAGKMSRLEKELASKERVAKTEKKTKAPRKFETKMVKTGDVINGMPVERDTPMVINPYTGRGYTVENGRAKVYGETREAPKPPKPGELKFLQEYPTQENLDLFARTYFYIPEDLLKYYLVDPDD